MDVKQTKKVRSIFKSAFEIEASGWYQRVDAARKKPATIIKNLNNFWRRDAEKVLPFSRYMFV